MIQRAALLLFFLASTWLVSAQKIHISKEGNGFWLLENEDKIMFFQRNLNDSIPEYARNNYFHPVLDLKGQCITEDFPADHLHHRGIFWAWHQILVNGKAICDPWDIKNFDQNISQIEFSADNDGNGSFKYTSFWHTKDDPDDPFIQEKTRVTIHPRTSNYRQIDFSIMLRALENNLSIGGSTDEKGYGGFSVRLKTNEESRFTNNNGEHIIPTNLSMQAGDWIDIFNPELNGGLVIIPWSQNPGEINEWILRQTGSAQNCKWPGRFPVPLQIEQALSLNYTLIIYNRKLNKTAVNRIYKNIQVKEIE